MSKYDPLINFLENCAPDCDEIKLSLKQIEIILRDNLPDAARTYHAWWHGRDRPHVKRWVDIGWKVEVRTVNGEIKWVIFTKKR